MEIYTIGFTKKSAAQFFGTLRSAGIGQLLDVIFLVARRFLVSGLTAGAAQE